MKYISWHIGDWMSSTMDLSPTERGVYFDLLCRYYQTESPIMRSQCERITRGYADSERAAFDYVLATFFVEKEDGFHNIRADEEIAAFQEKSEKARKSAAARWKKSDSDANAMQTQCERITDADANAMLTVNRKPETNNQEEKSAPRPRKRVERPKDVDPQVWADWLKARKAPLTQTAWEGVVREAEKAGITVEEAVRCCAEAGWRGFRADWYQNRTATATRKPAARSSELDFDSIDYHRGINPDGTF